MAEPARLPKEDQPDIRPDLRALEGGGETSTPKRDRLREAAAGGSNGGPAAGGENKSLYNPDELSDKEDKADTPEDEDNDNGLFTKDKDRDPKKFRSVFKKRRTAIGVGIGGVGIFGIVMLSSIAQGPLQLIHLSEILQKNFFGSNQVSKVRLRDLYRYYNGQVGETRVSVLGSKVVGHTTDQLKDVGIEFQRDSLDHIKSATIDTGKLQQSYPELEHMDDSQRLSFLSQKFELPESELVRIGTGSDVNGMKVAVNTRDFGINATRALTKNSLAALDDGKVVTGIKFREMSKFYNLPSLFHPLKKLSASAEDKATVKVERAVEAKRQADLEKPAATEAEPIESSLKDKLSGQNIVGGALLLTAGLCLVRSTADLVTDLNYAAIVTPAVVKASDKIAVGDQARSGQDIDASTAGAVADSLVDDQGRSVFQGEALQVTASEGTTGTDIPYEYKQAFSNDTTAQHIKDTIGSPTIAGIDIGDAACSKAGIIIQGAAGVALAAGSIIAAIPSGGASIAAEAAKLGAGAAAVAGATYLIQQIGANVLADKAAVPAETSGPLGGNILAYGAREAANVSARSGGGVPLTASGMTQLAKQQQQQDQQSFRSESFFARMFDTSDYHSLTGHLADSLSPSMAQNAASLTTGFTHIGSLLPHALSSIFTPKANADNTYYWGFAVDSIPSDVLNNPQLQDPYANAEAVAKIMDAGDPNGYAAKAQTCFGSTIQKDSDGNWDVTPPDKPVNANSDDYVNANCGDTSDLNWQRVMLFVSDTGTMNAAACYQGDDDSCAAIGYDQSASVSGAASPSSPSAGIFGSGGSGPFTTDTSHPAYPGVDQMLARVKSVAQPDASASATAAFCASIDGCSGKCESAVEVGWLGHRGQYADPFGNSNPSGPPGPDSAWAAALASGHAHPKDRNPPVGALLIYTIPGDEFGHITIYLGNNMVFSTDFDYQGQVGAQPASHIETASWANSYVGWMDPYFSGKVGT